MRTLRVIHAVSVFFGKGSATGRPITGVRQAHCERRNVPQIFSKWTRVIARRALSDKKPAGASTHRSTRFHARFPR
jgi:hypothetical protein